MYTSRSNYTLYGILTRLAFLITCAVVFVAYPFVAHASESYRIYPRPHSITYAQDVSPITLREHAILVRDNTIDQVTSKRATDAMTLVGSSLDTQSAIPADSQTVLLVGTFGSNDVVDTYYQSLLAKGTIQAQDGLLDKYDAYALYVLPADQPGSPDVILVMGKNTDAAFYGLTTLYQILQQAEGAQLLPMTIFDYADVASRGFIEGYYGEPWSTQDRINLMTWAGYYKQNVYFYAPKDDPKHAARWYELYTEDELATKVEPLAEAGNASKCRFVYALHPFKSNIITSNNYDDHLQLLKNKFLQVIDHGVRQIAILADDFSNPGPELSVRLTTDITNWLHELQAMTLEDGSPKYPGLKDTLIFCPFNYMSHGESWYQNVLPNVNIINTGGTVWGTVSKNFAVTFQNNSHVAPYMWINWPCTDNTKSGLIMGGHNDFLGSDVLPGQIRGLIINPMQQSEPSKEAIFLEADYTWNLWNSDTNAQNIWNDSFSYVDHNSPLKSEGSNALRELSKHMMESARKGGDQGESAEIKDIITQFRTKLTTGNASEADFDQIEKIFVALQTAAKTYREQHGTPEMFTQMEPWIDAWDDICKAMIDWCEAAKADLKGDSDALLTHYNVAQAAYKSYGTHGFSYIDHNEYAKVGLNYITPLADAFNAYVSAKVGAASNPDTFITSYISDVFVSPTEGKIENITDGDSASGVIFKQPNFLYTNNYIGIVFNKPKDIDTVIFAMGANKNHMYYGKLQVSYNGTDWEDVANQSFAQGRTADAYTYKASGLGLVGARGVRIIATRDNGEDLWLEVRDIAALSKDEISDNSTPELPAYTLHLDGITDTRYSGSSYNNIIDNNENTTAYLYSTKSRDAISSDSGLRLQFAEPINLSAIKLSHQKGSGDRPNSGGLRYQYQIPGSSEWVDAGTYNGADTQTITLAQPIKVQAVRVWLVANKPVWWRVSELSVMTADASDVAPSFSVKLDGITDTRYSGTSYANITDKNYNNTAYLYSTATNNAISANSGVRIQFDSSARLLGVKLAHQPGSGDRPDAGKMVYQYQPVGSSDWVSFGTFDGSDTQTVRLQAPVEVQAVRLWLTGAKGTWWRINELEPLLQTSAASSKDVDTNIEGAAIQTESTAGKLSVFGTRLNFAADSYVKLDLGAIRNGVTLEGSLTDSVELKTSQNNLEWVSYTSGARARYVGIFAKGSGGEVSLPNFSVNYTHKDKAKLLRSDVGGAANADFMVDQTISTYGTFKSTVREGQTIVFDLGQTRHIRSVRYEIIETQKDFIRNAKVEVTNSPDATEWTEVLSINADNPAPNVYNEDVAKSAAWLTHDSKNPGYMYTVNPKDDTTTNNAVDTNGTDELSVDARYMRIRFTATYSHRWVGGDLIINDGEYISLYGDGTFEQPENGEAQGTSPNYLLDKKQETLWQPKDASGSLTYYVDAPYYGENKAYEGIRVVSAGELSGATVLAELYTDETYTTTKTVELGSLNSVVADFRFVQPKARRVARSANPDSSTSTLPVKSVTVTWTDKKPTLAELYLLKSAPAATEDELSGLQAKIDQAKAALASQDTYTKTSKDALQARIGDAEKVLASAKAGTAAKTRVASALQNLSRSLSALATHYMGSELQELVDAAVTNDDGSYTPTSFAAYNSALTAAKEALGDPSNLDDKTAGQLISSLQAAKDGLVYDRSMYNRAKQFASDMDLRYTDELLTTKHPDGVAAYRAARKELQDLLDGSVLQPVQLRSAMEKLRTEAARLVDIAAAQDALKEFDIDSAHASEYTKKSFAAYKEAADALRAAIAAGSNAQEADIDQVTAAVLDAKKKLEVAPDVDLQAILDDAKTLNKDDFSEQSYADLDRAIKHAEDPNAPEELSELAQAIVDAKAALVNVSALKTAIAKAEALDLSVYTTASADALRAALEVAKDETGAGTTESVKRAKRALDSAYAALDLKYSDHTLQDLVKAAKSNDEGSYTAESFAGYAGLLAKAKEALANADNLSAADGRDLALALEKAEAELVKQPSNSVASNVGAKALEDVALHKKAVAVGKRSLLPKTADSTNIYAVMLCASLGALGVVAALLQKRHALK